MNIKTLRRTTNFRKTLFNTLYKQLKNELETSFQRLSVSIITPFHTTLTNELPATLKDTEQIQLYLKVSVLAKVSVLFPKLLKDYQDLQQICFVDQYGKTIGSTSGTKQLVPRDLLQEIIRDRSLVTLEHNAQTITFIPFYFEGSFLGGSVTFLSNDEFDKGRINLLTGSMIQFVIFLLLGFVGIWWLATSLSSPIVELADITQTISTNADYSIRVKENRIDEIGILSRSFNNMLEQIQAREIKRGKAEEELRRIEGELHQAQKMEAIGLMAGGVAHDLNNILAGIIGYPELMLLKLAKDNELREPIRAIQESGQRAAIVVADLLTVARGAASIRETHNLNVIAQDYLNSPECEKQKTLYPQITYQHQFMAEHSVISCSPIHVKKCIMNLMINAAEAMEDVGTITISTRNQSVDNIVGSEQEMKAGEHVIISVQDTGSGISNFDLGHIFEPFYTKKKMGKSGTGLGLAIVWSTMEDHEGKVFVESSDEGTCFQLYFPVSKEEDVQFKNDKEAQHTGNNEHVLLVDDEPQLRDIASQMLLTLGYKVDSVPSGELALQFLREKPVDLLVIDMQMDPGINGRQTYEEIIKRYPDQKAVIASGFSESDDVKATLQLGAGGFIKKPYSIEQIGRAVKEALHS